MCYNQVMKITDEEIARLAELSALDLTPSETAGLKRDLENIVGYVAQLKEVDTEGVEPTYQVYDLLLNKKVIRKQECFKKAEN